MQPCSTVWDTLGVHLRLLNLAVRFTVLHLSFILERTVTGLISTTMATVVSRGIPGGRVELTASSSTVRELDKVSLRLLDFQFQ